ncbi:hypothetical protein HZB78_02030 [Candidatus Collierbacteria bacterium]|nr:hypothetical protein [Candidatus Collierbacteria bacterium]
MNIPFLVNPFKPKKSEDPKSKEFSPVTQFAQGITTIQDILAPDAIEVDFTNLKIGNRLVRTLFVAGYPRFVAANWLSPLINFDHSLDVSMFIYPVEGKGVLENLRRKITEMEAEINSDMQRGRIANIDTQVKLEDAKALQEQLAKGSERFYQFGLYVTIGADNEEELNHITKQIQSTLGSLLIIAKPASFVMEQAFKTTQPLGQDFLNITRNMDTTSLATTFPFTSSELSANEGILYGINEHNDSLVVFDRFSRENANMVVFAKSGAGKCLMYQSKVIVRHNTGEVKICEIGQLINNLMSQKKVVTFSNESDGVVNPKLQVLTYDQNQKPIWANVEIAARKTFNKRRKIYKISTKSGREITVTPDHQMIIMRNGKIRTIRAEAVAAGECVPLPRFIPKPASNFSLSQEYLTLLGLITSEGLIYQKFVRIFNTDPAVLSIIKDSFNALKIKHYLLRSGGKRIGISSGKDFATKVIADGAGGKSGEKRIPPRIFSLSNDQIAQYLRAYYEGDGGVENHEVAATTKSKDLASDMAYILLRFGIIARIHSKRKAAINTKKQTKNTYFQITISGKDQIQKFADKIGFLTKTKNQKLAFLLQRTGNGNTNVDTVPGLQPIFKHLSKSIYPTSEIKTPQVIIDIKNGNYNPSRKQLLHAISLCEIRLNQLRSLAPYIKLLRELPSVSRLVRLGSKSKQFNRLLWEKLGDSWRNIKRFLHPPLTQNALFVYQTVSGKTLTASLLSSVLYEAFKQQGQSMRQYDKSLWNAVVLEKSKNPKYQTLFKAARYISQKYRSTQLKIRHAKEKLSQLKLLANSNLFWDPIVSVEKIKHHEKYVYDLQVDNGVFLAGHGGMFVHNSYFVKLEALRSLMFDTEVIVIDPEDEYHRMSDAVNGQYIDFSFASTAKINPFDLPSYARGSSGVASENELSQKLLSLHALMKIMLGTMDASQEAILDRALIAAYKANGISPNPETFNNEPPLLEDLYKALAGMETPEAANLAARLEKFVKGSFRGLVDQKTNVNLTADFIVFGIKNLEDELRPVAMFMILDFIWTKVKSQLKRRLLIVDEAWYLMKNQDSALFLYSMAKRARKYYLGLTTITQDVEDFLHSDYGKAIVTNSSIQILMKQSAAAVDSLQEAFYLSAGEKQLLMASEIGEGLFFAGQNHVAIKVIASPEEHKLITSKPQEILDIKAGMDTGEQKISPESNYWKPQKSVESEPLALNEIEVDVNKAQKVESREQKAENKKQETENNEKPLVPGAAVQPSIEFTSIFETKPKINNE